MTNDNTNTDEPSKAELHDRVEKLESTVAKMMPSRRDALRMGAAGIAGAAGLSATTQPADASTGSAGTIGSNSDRPDLFADDIDANSLSGSVKNQGCRVFLSSNQGISVGTNAKIKFDREVFDSDGNFDTSSHDWTCPQDGLYLVNLQVEFSIGGNDETRQATIGTATTPFPSDEGAVNRQHSSDTSDRISVSTINTYDSGDTIAAYAANFDSNDRVNNGSGNSSSFLEVAFLGGL
jgi:hypothetical protein